MPPVIVVRNLFRAKPGRPNELAPVMAESMRHAMAVANAPSAWWVPFDRSGPFDTVVPEAETESMVAREAARREMFTHRKRGQRWRSAAPR